MALRREDLSPDELERQEALDRSWAAALSDLANTDFRDYLRESLRRLDTEEPPLALTRQDFLARTEVPGE